MRGPPEPHHVLKEKGLLHEWRIGALVPNSTVFYNVFYISPHLRIQTYRSGSSNLAYNCQKFQAGASTLFERSCTALPVQTSKFNEKKILR